MRVNGVGEVIEEVGLGVVVEFLQLQLVDDLGSHLFFDLGKVSKYQSGFEDLEMEGHPVLFEALLAFDEGKLLASVGGFEVLEEFLELNVGG